MRASRINAPSIEPWMGPVRPRGTISGIVPPAGGQPGDVSEVAGPEPEGRTTPFERIEAPIPEPLPDPVEEADEVAVEAPAPLPVAPGSRLAAGSVLRLTRIGKYELASKIGHGSFGVVYTARDTELDREVALKILNPSHHGDDDALHRFLREARAAARVAHPGIVTVHDCGRYVPEDGDELAYIAMELLAGESLTHRLDRVGCLPPEAAVEIARQVASALDAAHRADVLHRDLKPDNVFLVPDPAVPSGERVKVLDFGLAKIGTSRHTQLGSVFGTPLYMSPEQCRSSGEIDLRSDVYALGCILFELLTGRAPFEGAVYEVLESHLRCEAPRVSSLVPETPPALDALVATMLEKDPNDRPATMADVILLLDGAVAVRARGSARAKAPADAPAEAPAEAPVDAPVVLDEVDRVVLDALRAPRFATVYAQEPRRRRLRGPFALIAAIAIAIAIAGALSLVAATRSAGAAPAPAELQRSA
jgi:hypothetical protein